MLRLNTIENVAYVQISINKHNTFELTFLREFKQLLQHVESDDSVLAVVISGNGRSFCSGADLAAISTYSRDRLIDFFHELDCILYCLYTYSKPTIAHVNGHAIGGGLAIACAVDYSLASISPCLKLGFPEYKIGMSFTTTMWEILFGRGSIRREPILLGAIVDPTAAYRYGWLTEVCDNNVESRLENVVSEFVKIPKDAFIRAKRKLNSRITKPLLSNNSNEYCDISNQLHSYLIREPCLSVNNS